MPFVRQALQLGRVVDAIVKCLLIDDSHLPLGSSDLSKLALRNKAEMLGDIGVLIEPDEPDNDDLLGRRTVLRSVRSVRNVHHRIQSKRVSLSHKLAYQKERQAIKQEKRVVFAVRTLMLLRRLDKSSLQQMFSMTPVCF